MQVSTNFLTSPGRASRAVNASTRQGPHCLRSILSPPTNKVKGWTGVLMTEDSSPLYQTKLDKVELAGTILSA